MNLLPAPPRLLALPPPTHFERCGWCDGRGWVRINFAYIGRHCPTCGGSGWRVLKEI